MKQIFTLIFILLTFPMCNRSQQQQNYAANVAQNDTIKNVKTVKYIHFPVIYGDGMVLQREQKLRLRGHSEPGAFITAELNGIKASAPTNEKGDFEITLPAQKAGGPYELKFTGGKYQKTFKNVYVGEVWLCSGQSNMEFALRYCSTAREDINKADKLPQVHLYNIKKTFIPLREVWSRKRINEIDRNEYVKFGSWEVSSAKSAADFSALGFHFARLISKKLNCHVGVICNAVDGSTTEGWIDSTSLKEDTPEILEGSWLTNPNIMKWARNRAAYNLKATDASKHAHPYQPTYLFNAAIRPLEAFPIRGVLWYQGESNAELVAMHERLFPLLEKSWRRVWQNPDMPFYFVQLSSLSNMKYWPAFRDSQRRMADRLPHTYMTVSTDMGDPKNIHPKRKIAVAERLAASALHHTYGFKNIVPSGPTPIKAQAEGANKVRIDFGQAKGLHFSGTINPAHFEVCSAQGVCQSATRINVDGKSVIVEYQKGFKACKVRYAYKPYTTANLVNGAKLPCSTFEIKINGAE